MKIKKLSGITKATVAALLAAGVIAPTTSSAAPGDLWKDNGDGTKTNLGTGSQIFMKSGIAGLIDIQQNSGSYFYEGPTELYTFADADAVFNKYPNLSVSEVQNQLAQDLTGKGQEIPTQELVVESVTAINATTLKVVFNKELGDSALLKGSYDIIELDGAADITVASVALNGKEVTITASGNIEPSKKYFLRFINVTDVNGNKIAVDGYNFTSDVPPTEPVLTAENVTVLLNGKQDSTPTNEVPGQLRIALPDGLDASGLVHGDITIKEKGVGTDLVTSDGVVTPVAPTSDKDGYIDIKLDNTVSGDDAKLLEAGKTYEVEIAKGKITTKFGIKNSEAIKFEFTAEEVKAQTAAAQSAELKFDKSGKLVVEVKFDVPVYTKLDAGGGAGSNITDGIQIVTENGVKNFEITAIAAASATDTITVDVSSLVAGDLLADKKYSVIVKPTDTTQSIYTAVHDTKVDAVKTLEVTGLDTVSPKITAVELVSAKEAKITLDKEIVLADNYDFTFNTNTVKADGLGDAKAAVNGNVVTITALEGKYLHTELKGGNTSIEIASSNDDGEVKLTNGFKVANGLNGTWYLTTDDTSNSNAENRLVTDSTVPELVEAKYTSASSGTITLTFSEKVTATTDTISVLGKNDTASWEELATGTQANLNDGTGVTTLTITGVDAKGYNAGSDQIKILAGTVKALDNEKAIAEIVLNVTK